MQLYQLYGRSSFVFARNLHVRPRMASSENPASDADCREFATVSTS